MYRKNIFKNSQGIYAMTISDVVQVKMAWYQVSSVGMV